MWKPELEKICGEKFEVLSEITVQCSCYVNFIGEQQKIDIRVSTEYGGKNEISENQANQIKHFFSNQNEYFSKAKEEIENYVQLDKEIGNDCIPNEIPADFKKYVNLKNIRVTYDETDSPAALCLLFDYKYDESGICVMFRDGEIIETGSQDLLVC